MEPITIKAFIGSNNKTKKLEVDKIISTVSINHEALSSHRMLEGRGRRNSSALSIRRTLKGDEHAQQTKRGVKSRSNRLPDRE